MMFFTVLILMFSLWFDVLDVDTASEVDEYKVIGQFVGNIF